MHYVSLPWKLFFALIPPTDYYNGWLCFFAAIFMIGVLTAVIGDLAAHFGCTVGLKDSVTAISLVAMGTSIPGSPPAFPSISRRHLRVSHGGSAGPLGGLEHRQCDGIQRREFLRAVTP